MAYDSSIFAFGGQMSQIKIFNWRAGFANNSSSTHSIIFSKDPIDKSLDDYENLTFGWYRFTIASEMGILNYLNATVRGNLEYGMDKSYVTAIANSWTAECLKPEYDYGTVDHQSLITLPLTFSRNALNKEYFDELKELLLTSNTLILGGNDNDDQVHDLYDSRYEASFQVETSRKIAKKDHVNNYWTLYDPNNGNRIRMVFDKTGEKTVMPTKASSPDLVDMKITSYCNFGCKFCYMDSTSTGYPADFAKIQQTIDFLKSKEVFEIAYGGGEPTTHPDFINILKYTAAAHITPNFTTKNFKWLKENFAEIKDVIGSCAYSISNAYDIKQIATLQDYYDLPSNKIVAQYVLGSDPLPYGLTSIIKSCSLHNVSLTLLGFKTVGRGGVYQQFDYSEWFDLVLKLRTEGHCCQIGIDTALVQQSEEILKLAKVPHWLYHKDEGAFSWYIDAVDNKMGPSSYEPTTAYKSIYSDFDKQYNDFQSRNFGDTNERKSI